MKRCPQCNRVETDELKFCRVDGSTLVSDSSSFESEQRITSLGSASVAAEIETSILPHRTDAGMSRPTSPTTVLAVQSTPGASRELRKPKQRWAILAAGTVIAIAVVTAAYFYMSRKNNPAITSIAVMPFINESGNADVEYLSDGMTDTLISSLSQLPNLSVKAHASVFRYKGKEQNPKTIGKELNVRAILNGRFAQRGDRLTLTLELVDAETENVIWSEQYNRKQNDLVSLQSEIARDVSSKLRARLSGADERKVTKSYTTNTEAYQLYLKGRYNANKFSTGGWKKALDYYNQALEKDPAYPLPYVGIAEYYQLNSNSTLPPTDAQPRAEAFARKALELDETLSEAHTALGAVRFYRDWNWAEAEREFQRAIELSPNSADAHYWYGYTLTMSGRFDTGLSEMKRATELDPLNPTINADLCWTHFFARKLDEAARICQQTLEIETDSAPAHAYLGMAYGYQGKHAEAIAELLKSRQLDQVPMTVALLGHVYARAGHTNEAKQAVEDLTEMTKNRFVSPYNFAIIYAALGDKEQSFAYLEKAYDGRADSMVYLNSDPLLDNVRSDQRFADLVRRVGQ